IELPLRRELATKRVPQPALRPLDLGVPIGPLQPIRREMAADRPIRVVPHRKHERTPDHTVLRAKLEQYPLYFLGHRHHPGLALLVMLGPPADGLLVEIEVIPPEVAHAAEPPARPVHQLHEQRHQRTDPVGDRKSTRLNSSHGSTSYA